METERRATPSEALQKRVEFLEAAEKDGAKERALGRRTALVSQVDIDERKIDPIARRINIVGILNGSPATGSDLGRQYGVERERIRQLHNEGMRHLHCHSSPQTQEKFPLNSILGIDKPPSLHSREQQSEVEGGTSITIRKAIGKGAKTVEDISKATGFSRKKVSRTRSTLKVWGIEVPKDLTGHTNFKEIKERVDKEEDWEKLQEILDSRPGISIIRYIDNHREKGQDLFAFLGVVAREAGFKNSRQVKLLYGVLVLLGIPVRQIRTGFYVKKNKKGDVRPQYYYVTLAKLGDTIKRALSNDPSLQGFRKNPVKQFKVAKPCLTW